MNLLLIKNNLCFCPAIELFVNETERLMVWSSESVHNFVVFFSGMKVEWNRLRMIEYFRSMLRLVHFCSIMSSYFFIKVYSNNNNNKNQISQLLSNIIVRITIRASRINHFWRLDLNKWRKIGVFDCCMLFKFLMVMSNHQFLYR